MIENSVGFCIFYDWLEVFELLDKEDVADLLFAIGRYSMCGSNLLESVSDRVKPVAMMIFKQLERAKKRSDAQPDVSKGRGLGEGFTKTETKTDKETDTPTKTETNTKPHPHTKTETKTNAAQSAEKQKSAEDKPPPQSPESVFRCDPFGGGGAVKDNLIFVSLPNKPTLAEIEQYVKECELEYVNPKEFYEYNEQRGWVIDGEPVRDWRSVIGLWNAKRRPTAGERPAKVKYGNYDPNEAFLRALRRSYGCTY